MRKDLYTWPEGFRRFVAGNVIDHKVAKLYNTTTLNINITPCHMYKKSVYIPSILKSLSVPSCSTIFITYLGQHIDMFVLVITDFRRTSFDVETFAQKINDVSLIRGQLTARSNFSSREETTHTVIIYFPNKKKIKKGFFDGKHVSSIHSVLCLHTCLGMFDENEEESFDYEEYPFWILQTTKCPK